MPAHDVIVIGAGLAGLGCAVALRDSGVQPLLLEAGDGVGGRVRTDDHEGFLLDRGFQVLLEAYPECQRVLDYEALDLQPFFPGAKIWTGRGFARFADPLRRPRDAMATLMAPIGSVQDKLRINRLRGEVLKGTPESVLHGPDISAQEDLERLGFTPGMIESFFRPFFGGVLLNRELTDSCRIFRYIFRMFSAGPTSIPRRGMGEIPKQLAGGLTPDSIRFECRVASLRPGGVLLESGEELGAEAVVVATEGPEAARLLFLSPEPGSKAATCMYFDAPEPPVTGPMLVLDGEGRGPVNNLAVMSQVSPDYAPETRHLVSLSLPGLPSDEEEVRAAALSQMKDWFGNQVEGWRHLRTYKIPHAQPGQYPGALDPPERGVEVEQGVFVCGDHRETASIQGALHSGRRGAEAVLESVGGSQ